MNDAAGRQELARFLKAMRGRVSPAELGLPVSPRRRARGLLREEVAQAAGMSATWYAWMEQAREIKPSQRVLDGLVRALRLNPVERAHLFRLARPDLQPTTSADIGRTLSPSLTAFLHGLAPHPAYALNGLWDVIGWNDPAARLLGGFETTDRATRNVLARLFLDPAWRALFSEWETIARSAVGQFRAAAARLCGDPDYARFVKSLEAARAFSVYAGSLIVLEEGRCSARL